MRRHTCWRWRGGLGPPARWQTGWPAAPSCMSRPASRTAFWRVSCSAPPTHSTASGSAARCAPNSRSSTWCESNGSGEAWLLTTSQDHSKWTGSATGIMCHGCVRAGHAVLNNLFTIRVHCACYAPGSFEWMQSSPRAGCTSSEIPISVLDHGLLLTASTPCL